MVIEFRESAFRHNKSEADIRRAFMNPCYDGPIEDDSGKNDRFIRLGFDTSGNLLEMLYNEYGDMETMTEEEAFALDEYYTKNPPKVDPSKARIRVPMVRIDNITAEYLSEKAKASHEKPEEILSGLVREKLAVSV